MHHQISAAGGRNFRRIRPNMRAGISQHFPQHGNIGRCRQQYTSPTVRFRYSAIFRFKHARNLASSGRIPLDRLYGSKVFNVRGAPRSVPVVSGRIYPDGCSAGLSDSLLYGRPLFLRQRKRVREYVDFVFRQTRIGNVV